MAEEITPYTNIERTPLPPEGGDVYGSQYFGDVRALQVGIGAQVLRADQQGLWLGAEDFASAPFSVDMQGNVKLGSITTFGGDLDDIPDGSTYKRAVQNQLTGGDRAYNGMNSSSEIIKGFLDSQLSSKSLPTNGVRIDSNGIYGRDGGTTTFYINDNGDAYFSGDIVASDITGGTITGALFRTATSGERIEIDTTNTNQIRFYDSSTLYGYIEVDKIGSDGYVNLKTVDGNGLEMDTGIGASGFNSCELGANGGVFATNGNASNGWIGMYSNGANNYIHIHRGPSGYVMQTDTDFEPETDRAVNLGSSTKRWDNVYCDDLETFDDIDVGGDLRVTDDVEVTDNLTVDDNIEITEGFMNLAQMTGTTASGLVGDQDGSMYYRTDDDVIRVKINGSWETVTTS